MPVARTCLSNAGMLAIIRVIRRRVGSGSASQAGRSSFLLLHPVQCIFECLLDALRVLFRYLSIWMLAELYTDAG